MSTLVKRAAPLSQLTTMADSRWIHFELLNKLHAARKRGIAFFDDSDSIGRMALVDGLPQLLYSTGSTLSGRPNTKMIVIPLCHGEQNRLPSSVLRVQYLFSLKVIGAIAIRTPDAK